MTGVSRFAAILLVALALCMPVAGSAADDLDSAKEAGQVGERFDGYLGIVDTAAPADVTVLVEDINAKRRKAYEKLAARNRVEIEVIEVVAGTKAVERTKSGQYVMPSADSGWQKKE